MAARDRAYETCSESGAQYAETGGDAPFLEAVALGPRVSSALSSVIASTRRCLFDTPSLPDAPAADALSVALDGQPLRRDAEDGFRATQAQLELLGAACQRWRTPHARTSLSDCPGFVNPGSCLPAPDVLRWREPMPMRHAAGAPGAQFVEVDGVQLAVSREGAGPPVVCLHAIGHGGADFDAFAAALRHRYEILRLDWPGQGRSGDDVQPASARRYAALLIGALDRLGVRAPVLIGNSIGGAAALLCAAERPVAALVLCDPGGLVAVNLAVRIFCAAFSRFFAAGARRARWFPRAFAWYYRRLVLPSPAAAAQRERIIAAGCETAPILRDAWRSFARPDADLRGLARSLQVPVWFAWARHDRVVPLALCKPSIARMRDATLSLFDGGHSAFLEQPEAFAQAFLAFMAARRVEAAAPAAACASGSDAPA